MLFYRQFSLENVLFYVKCRGKGVNGNRTLAIQFKTGRNKTFSELYHYLFVSFGFIESWVVPIRSRKERRLELLWIFNWATITIPAYLRFSSLRLRVNLYIYLLSIARWVKVGTESRLIKGCLRQLYLSMRGRLACLITFTTCFFLYHFDVDFLLFCEIEKLEEMELMRKCIDHENYYDTEI